MLKIQVISNKKIIRSNDFSIRYAPYNSPMTFDMFDINIINLQDENIWKNNGSQANRINITNDLISLNALIKNNTKSKVVILMPMNYNMLFLYNKYDLAYEYQYNIKDRLDCFYEILRELITGIGRYQIIFENSRTKCEYSFFDSSFSFLNCDKIAVTKAEGSGRATTICLNERLYLTTLLMESTNCNFKDFIEAIGLADEKLEYPQWLIELERFDDVIQRDIIKNDIIKIEELKCEIERANEIINKNLNYKSILIENGERLISVVFDILQTLLMYDLSGFKDEKKEDFLIKLDNITFIGEIKGITSNVKSENISQLDVHYQSYLEKLQEDEKEEEIKALLIINSQRNKPLEVREPIHKKQVDLAIRNGSLIITTEKLLSLYEKFIANKIDTNRVIKLFTEQTGLFEFD